ncbi:MAG TPA: tryptophan synthase subunit alpha [Sedimentisphaerales bacterium]|nr:tryptophan synthase subunit alpha [Sedimentisphaerales bacterium]
MKSYQEVFSNLKSQGRAALIPFFVIGDPDFDTSLTLVKAAIDAGADVLELGIPFSDPIADGPTIQKADVRAMRSGMNTHKACEFIRQVKRHKDVPIGLLMYYNLIQQYGRERFFKDFRDAGVNSVLVADLSIDDADEILTPLKNAGLDSVFMVTPNTSTDRMKRIAAQTTGFIYAVSLLGVTGSREALSSAAEGLVRRLKSLTNIPICVGFGVSKPEHAKTIRDAGAEGVIIGSRLVAMIEDHIDQPSLAIQEISRFLTEVRNTLAAK